MNKERTITRLKKVEEILNVSNDTIDEIELSDEQSFDLQEREQYDILDPDDNFDEDITSIVELRDLKKTFVMVKRNLQKLVVQGQTLMSQTIGVNIMELKASEIDAISKLSAVVSDQLKMMITIYQDIIKIEKDIRILNSDSPIVPEGTTLKQTNVTINTTTASLIKQITDNINN